MWVSLLILSFAVYSLASKELMSLRSLPKEEKEILFQLVKRLKQGGSPDETGWIPKEEPKCDVSPKNSSIIKKKDSLDNGAQFLTLSKDVKSNEACSEQCCKNMTCDLAVFENKGDHYCYLFRCEGKCKFGHHSSYISNNVYHSRKPPSSAAEGSELDLIGLDHGPDSDSHSNNDDAKDNSFQAQPVATSTAPPFVAAPIRAHSVGLDGPTCQLDLHCEDPNAVCNYHKCNCQDGYYKKGPTCREVCPPSNFVCLELGTVGRGPQCVPQAQVCDSITQCADGSDEFNCPPDSGAPPIRTWQQQQQQQQQQQLPPQSEPSQQNQPPPQQQQHTYLSPDYPDTDYSQQGVHSNGAGSQASSQAFSGGADSGQYPSYNQQQQQQQPSKPQQRPQQNSGPPASGSQQSPHNAPGPDTGSGYNNGGYAGQGSKSWSGSESRQPQDSGQQKQQPRPAAADNDYPTGLSGQKAPQQPAFQRPVPQPQPHSVPQPQQQQQAAQGSSAYQTSSAHENDLKDLTGQQPQHKADTPPAYPNSPQRGTSNGQQPPPQPGYPSSQSQPAPVQQQQQQQQYPPARGPAAQQQQQQAASAGSRRPPSPAQQPHSDPRPQSQSGIYVEGGGRAGDGSTGQAKPQQKTLPLPSQRQQQDSQRVPVPPRPSNPQQGVVPARPKPSAHNPGPRPNQQPPPSSSGSSSSLDRIDSRKPYVVTGHKAMNKPPAAAVGRGRGGDGEGGPKGKGVPEKPRHHSAYDVRIGGEPSVPLRDPDSDRKSFLNPSELTDLDAQGPPHFLGDFGDQYLPQQQNFGPSSYNSYNNPRYPSGYPQSSGGGGRGGGGGGYPGMSEQLYNPGSGPGQRGYSQQGYLDFGYPSPQYEFGEFDPSYPEAEGYPGSHDLSASSAYRPNSKLGYDGPYKSQGVEGPLKHHDATLTGDDHKLETSKIVDGKGTDDGMPAAIFNDTVPGPVGGQSSGIVDSSSSKDVDTDTSSHHDDSNLADNTDHTRLQAPGSEDPDEPQQPDTVHASKNDNNSKSAEEEDNSKDPSSEVIKNPPSSKEEDNNKDSQAAGPSSKEDQEAAQPPPLSPMVANSGSSDSDLVRSQDAFITRSRVNLKDEPSNMQGPILALALGLTFTFILLVFVACRLRTVRRRLRKGRPLHSNEADYLINGMYL